MELNQDVHIINIIFILEERRTPSCISLILSNHTSIIPIHELLYFYKFH